MSNRTIVTINSITKIEAIAALEIALENVKQMEDGPVLESVDVINEGTNNKEL